MTYACGCAQIFDKALTEVTFTELYAELCVCLSAKLPGFEDPDAEPTDGPKKLTVNFRRYAGSRLDFRTARAVLEAAETCPCL